MTTIEYTGYVEKLLASGLTEEAADSLLALMDTKNNDELRSQAVLLSGQYQDILEKQRLALDDDKFGIARVNHALIELNRDVAEQYGNENVPAELSIQIVHVLNKRPKPTVGQSNIKKIGILGLGLLVGAIVIFLYFNSTKVSSGLDNQSAVQSNNILRQSDNEVNSESSQTIAKESNVEGQKPIYIDLKAKVRDVELLETQYFPTNGDGKVIFKFKFTCASENSGGCLAFDTNFALEVNGKTYNPIKMESPLVSSNSDGLIIMEFKVPHGFTKMALKIGETLASNSLTNPMTITVDLSKTKTIVQKPIVLNYNIEKDLNIKKDFGFCNIHSIVVKPYSDTDIQVTVKFYKKMEPDFYNKCFRIVTDNNWRIAPFKEKELEQLKDAVEYEYSYKVPRTTQSAIFIVGNCESNSIPLSIPLTL